MIKALKTIQVDLTEDQHEALQYVVRVENIGQVKAVPQKQIAADLLVRGLTAMRSDADWLARAQAHEDSRRAALAVVGVGAPPA